MKIKNYYLESIENTLEKEYSKQINLLKLTLGKVLSFYKSTSCFIGKTVKLKNSYLGFDYGIIVEVNTVDKNNYPLNVKLYLFNNEGLLYIIDNNMVPGSIDFEMNKIDIITEIL